MLFKGIISSRPKCAFIKGRRIGDNIRLHLDAIDLTATNEIPGSIFTVDIFNAFYLLNWDFIFALG